MARGQNQKTKLLQLLDILREESDEEHPLSLARIRQLLAARGVDADRKSLYDDFEQLRLLDYDVVVVGGGRSCGYYLGARQFEEAELRLLADAVQSSRFLTPKKSTALIGKLFAAVGRHRRAALSRQVYVANRPSPTGEGLLYTVDALHRAIAEGKQVSFRYWEYDPAGRRRFRREGARYRVTPHALCWAEEWYYLIGYDSDRGEIRHFRVDKTDALQVEALPGEGSEAFARFDMKAYTAATFGMFGGVAEDVVLWCHDRLCGVIYDRFGRESVLRPAEGGGFFVTVKVAVSDPFLGFVLSFGGQMRLLSPASAREKLIRLGREALTGYDEK